MTIDELLDEAQAHTSASIKEDDTDIAIRYALTAQACAMTAQAMMMHAEDKRQAERHSVWLDETFGEIRDDRMDEPSDPNAWHRGFEAPLRHPEKVTLEYIDQRVSELYSDQDDTP